MLLSMYTCTMTHFPHKLYHGPDGGIPTSRNGVCSGVAGTGTSVSTCMMLSFVSALSPGCQNEQTTTSSYWLTNI